MPVKALFIATLAVVFFGCKKAPETVSGGVVRIFLHVRHHDVPIPYARIFMKKDTVGFPGYDTTVYDQRYVTDSNGDFTLSGLPSGQKAYYFFAKGIDPGWDSTHVTPVIGYNFFITNTHIGENHDYQMTLAVSE